MCGIVGVFGLGCGVSIEDRALLRMRDTMVHRGPDDAGAWRCPWAALGHRRLSVIAPGPQGHQPMVTHDGRFALTYNGELYNDAEVRDELRALGVRFRTDSDTETVLMALAEWGVEAIDRLRGMYALGFVDRDEHRVILARDPLGVKPLYIARLNGPGGPQVAFASDPLALLAHPDARTEPDWACVSGYLSTIRPTLGRRTMFAGIETVPPGEVRVYDAAGDSPASVRGWASVAEPRAGDHGDTRSIIEDSILVHRRADVPMCALLSGGLDSAIVCTVARDEDARLRTYCAGARTDGFDDDFAHAERVAAELGTRHSAIEIDRGLFAARWAWMVERTGLPLSTPNEVAIYEVAAALARDGHVVALSGEGADELFGGYAPPMEQAWAHVRSLEGRPDHAGGLFHLTSNAWMGAEIKQRAVRDLAWARMDGDAALRDEYTRAFDEARESAPKDSALQPHLRFHRMVNLPNLLRRLDSATMLASVEGRTPFADRRVAAFAESLPMGHKFVPPGGAGAGTKIALRRAFAGRLTPETIERPKASFPLPFQAWVGAWSDALRTSSFAHELFNTEAVQTVAAAPEALWHLAWPMINLAMWGERWWGRGAVGIVEPAARESARVP